VDKEGNLGFPASAEEVRRFGASARKVFLRKPPSELLDSFAQVVKMNRDEERLSNRSWKRRGEEEREGPQDWTQAERYPRAKRLQGMGAPSGGNRNWGREECGGGHRSQEGWQGCRHDGNMGVNDLPRHGGGGDNRRPPGKNNDQHEIDGRS
jgi:hypothetical protein